MAQRVIALELLASKESTGNGFFDVAARALTIGLGCRWAGFGRLLADGHTVEVIAFWDAKGPSATFSYPVDNSPCGEIYNSTPDYPYRLYADCLTERFSGPPLLAQIGAVSYRGEAIFDSAGRNVAHAFAIGDRPFENDLSAEEFFRLVGQRAGAEFHRQSAEQALLRSREEAVVASRTKSEFLANMSHEFRTPLNAVLGFSDLMKTEAFGPLGDPRYMEYVDAIQSSGQHLLDVISNILDLSKGESGFMALHEDPVNVTEVLDMCLSLVAERARSGKITLLAEYGRDLPPLVVDGVKLKQIIINLLSNAVKFTPAGGTVTVRANVGEDGRMVFQVADTGIGIAAKQIAVAFEPFRQVDASTRTDAEGTGLGLPLVRLLTRLHDGSFDFESVPGEGTVATVGFPAIRTLEHPAGERNDQTLVAASR
ncbi:MAG: HAMP domain-containing sensor histidine kinase [Alphaproteobacteria bacterium]